VYSISKLNCEHIQSNKKEKKTFKLV